MHNPVVPFLHCNDLSLDLKFAWVFFFSIQYFVNDIFHNSVLLPSHRNDFQI